jgi:hypothetical protein
MGYSARQHDERGDGQQATGHGGRCDGGNGGSSKDGSNGGAFTSSGTEPRRGVW